MVMHGEKSGGDASFSSSSSSMKMVEESSLFIHKIGPPPKTTLLDDFKYRVKETFFPDDPFRHFKDRSRLQKLKMSIEVMFPILVWSRQYTLAKFKGDLIAGLTIASLCIPQDIGYAKLANLDPQHGLYSSFVPPLIYAVMGSSKDIAIGPVAVVSILMGTMIRKEINDTKSDAYLQLMFTSTFFAGVFQTAFGALRLGFLVDFLSHAAIVGFMGGAAITIALQQLKGLLGIRNFTTQTDIVSVMRSVCDSVHHGWNWQTIIIGIAFLFLLLSAKHIAKRKKKLFWVSAIAPLVSVVLSTLIVYLTRADKEGVKIVEDIKKGLNPPSLYQLDFNTWMITKAAKIGFVAALIALTEAIAIGRTFAALKGYHLDGNKEMVAFGLMNITGSFTSCYVATGSFSRSAVNYYAGCQTAISNVVMSVTVMFTLLFITPLFKYTPNAILASIIINAVISLIDIEAACLIWKIDKFDFIACLGAFIGVVFGSVEIGLVVAVGLSFAKILLHVTRPHTAVLGKIPGTNIYRNAEQYPDATEVPGILIVRVDSAIYFSNANYVRERILRWVEEEEDRLAKKSSLVLQFLIIEMSPIIDIDTSGIHALEELNNTLSKRNIQVALSNPGTSVYQKLHSSKFVEKIGQEWMFLTVAEAVQSCSKYLKFSI